MDKIIRVLIVDDSAYIRKVIKKMLSRSPFIDVVGVAYDGEEALEMVEQYKPDVITLDMVMPQMDGLAFLKKQMSRLPVRVIIVSITSESSERVLEALDLGAVDFVQKPTALATDKIFEISDELITKVKAAANVPITALRYTPTSSVPIPSYVGRAVGRKTVDVVAIGISTGGPQALRMLLPQLPDDFPVPIVIVLHMPVGYTKIYSEKLNEICKLEVIEANEGRELRPGLVLIAPAGKHLKFVRWGKEKVVAHLDFKPSATLHRPSVDVMFQSVAETFKKRTLGIVMTGMGSDGKQGAAWVKSQGGVIFTEAEESCVVYGMPHVVDEAGLSDKSVPLDLMGQRILEMV